MLGVGYNIIEYKYIEGYEMNKRFMTYYWIKMG